MRKRFAVAVLTCLTLMAANSVPLSAGPGVFTLALRGQAFPQLAVDPSNPKVVYAAGNDANYTPYVYKSFDSGNTWASVGSGLGAMAVFSLAISRANGQIVYLGGYNFTSRGIALYLSNNGGASWTQVGTSLGDNSVQAIALDPTNPTVSYLGLNHGVAKSTDGLNWTMLSGMGNANVQSLVIDRSTVPILYAGTSGTVNPGIWKSADGGQTWASVSTGLPTGNVLYLSVDSLVPSTLFAAVSNGLGQPALISKSMSSGQNWTNLTQTDTINALAVDPLNGLNVYYGARNGLYRSGDGGSLWTRIHLSGGGGFALDTVNPQTLFLGTMDGIATFTAAPPPALIGPAPAATEPAAVTPLGTGQSFTFAQTGYTVSGIWLDFLKSHGDVDNLGYPRTGVIRDTLVPNQTVQYFQRVVLEYHPEQPPGYEIQRRLLGDMLDPGADPPADPVADRPAGESVYFPNVIGQGLGHFVANAAPDGSPTLFKQYFDTHGREDAFGYPKEEPKLRLLSDGQMHWVQRFQAAVFEYHQENDREGANANGVPWRNYRVQLQLLGDDYIVRNNLGYR